VGTIIIRALAGGALSGTAERHPLAMQVVDPIGSAPNFAADVARAKQLETLVRESGSADLTEFAERFVISHPAVSTMLVGYSTLAHLEAAIAAVDKGPLPAGILEKMV
jgi:aryl-alcohol dehydrogenase-like predicted oxidoreductase